MYKISFDDLPEVVSRLATEVGEMKVLLQDKINHANKPEDEFLTVEGAAEFLGIKVATVYGLNSRGELPVMKRSKRCYFSKLDLIDYLKAGRRKTNAEIEVIANKRLTKNS